MQVPNRYHHSKKEQKRKLKPQALRQAKARRQALKKKHSVDRGVFFYKYLKSICKMDAQDFRNLQEAYMNVYENEQLDEGLDRKTFQANRKKAERSATTADARRRGHVDRLTGKPYSTDEARSRRKGIHTPEKAPERDAARDAAGGETGRGGRLRPNKVRKAKALGELGEQNDIYDIILSHLLDEGYAETPEAAEAIMVNMSEEWRECIVEADSIAAMAMRERAAKRRKQRYGDSDTSRWGDDYDFAPPPLDAAAKMAKRKAERKAAEEES